MIYRDKQFICAILAGLFLLNVVAWIAVHDLSRPGVLEIVFFDVGQGDAVLIKSPESHYILIDGGPDSGILEKLSGEIPVWQREIDLIVLTHGHSDHFTGLINVIERYGIRSLLWNGVIEDSPSFRKWQKSASESGAEIMISQAGQRIRGKDFFIDVLHPFSSLEGKEFKDANLSSLVLRLVFDDNSFLFMGDAYKSIERQLIEKEAFCSENEEAVCRAMVLQSDVLKVGHHGSKTSTAEEFLVAVSPRAAVISAGDGNMYGHPHLETLEILQKHDINIFRTDLEGNIKIISNGKNYAISNF